MALDEFEAVPTSTTVRRAFRIAQLRGDNPEELRFALELGMDRTLADVPPDREMDALMDGAEASFLFGRRRRLDADNLGVSDLDVFLQQPLHRLEVEAPAHEQRLSLISQIENENRRMVARDILSVIGNDTLAYLLRCERTLRFSTSGESIFNRHRERVDRFLEDVAPEVLDMLNAAIDRAAIDGDSEARVHALTSCRRVLTAVADLVFPARDEPYIDGQGNEREVGPNHYRNRIIAALESSPSTTHVRALSATLSEFALRLDRLDDLTQLGVHGHPTVGDVEFGVIQTYLLAGEVLAAYSPTESEPLGE